MNKERRYEKVDYKGNWNIGAFGLATDSFAILARSFRDEIINKAKKALNVPVIVQDFLLDSLVGSMILANSNGILLPEKEMEEKEEEDLKKVLRRQDIDVSISKINLNKHYNALGNLGLCLKDIIIFPEKIVEQNGELIPRIEDTMDAQVVGHNFSIKVPGSALVSSDKGILSHPEVKEDILETISNRANVRVGKGSINFGSPWVGNGLILNSHGFLAGRKTTGYEMAQIWRILYK